MFLIAICGQTGDKWKSKTRFPATFYPCSSIVKILFDCCLSGVVNVRTRSRYFGAYRICVLTVFNLYAQLSTLSLVWAYYFWRDNEDNKSILAPKNKWVWSGNTTITHCRPTHGTVRKRHRTLTVTTIRKTTKAKQQALSSSPRRLQNYIEGHWVMHNTKRR